MENGENKEWLFSAWIAIGVGEQNRGLVPRRNAALCLQPAGLSLSLKLSWPSLMGSWGA